MMHPTILTPAGGARSAKAYFLSEVRVEITDAQTAIFTATLNGPAGASVWARAWLSTELDGTLAESASACLTSGDRVTLTVKLEDARAPEIACIRIESAPLATEDVVILKVP